MSIRTRRWRRFRSGVPPSRSLQSNVASSEPHDSQQPHYFAQAYDQLEQQLRTLSRRRFRRFDIEQLEDLIHNQKIVFDTRGDVVSGLVLIALQAPRAVRAQRQMDKHPGGYHHNKSRLYELIDFNDSYVSTVLASPDALLPDFNEQLRSLIDSLCDHFKTPSFSPEQFEAITHGLSREIAVYRGAINEGLDASMTSRAQDAMGVDMIISDPQTNRSINVDVKTRSSFHFRLKDLVREGRITQEQADHAEQEGFCPEVNGHGAEAVNVILLRIDHAILGNIVHFAFENSQLLGTELHRIISEFGYESKVR